MHFVSSKKKMKVRLLHFYFILLILNMLKYFRQNDVLSEHFDDHSSKLVLGKTRIPFQPGKRGSAIWTVTFLNLLEIYATA